MTIPALSLVLMAAVLHASWNAIVKAVGDRAGVLAAVSAMHAMLGLALVLIFPAPAQDSWSMIAISVALHYAYYLLLFRSYALGDLSQVYPIARGIAPALVAISAAILIGEDLPLHGWIGVAFVSFGVGILALQGSAVAVPRGAIPFAICLGIVISAYSVADGIGIRKSESIGGYIGWLFLCEFPVPMIIALCRHRSRGKFESRVLLIGVLAGTMAVGAYGIVLYVNSIAPLGAVSAIRESSVIFAALIGIVVFRERPVGTRLTAAVIVAAGIIALSQ